MNHHIVDLFAAPHALIPNVLNSATTSDHHIGRDIEAALKRGQVPTAAEFDNAIRHISLGEQHHLIACYIAWANEAQVKELLSTVKLPFELCVADYHKDNFSDESLEPEDRYDTFCYSPKAWRTVATIRRDQIARMAASAEPEGSALYAWLDRASRSGLPDVAHAACVLKDYYQGVESTDSRSLTQKHLLANA